MCAIAGTYPPSLRAGIHPAEFSHGLLEFCTAAQGWNSGGAAALATAALVTTVLIWPPISKAAPTGRVDVGSIERMDLGVLPEFDATYQRRTGVLDPT